MIEGLDGTTEIVDIDVGFGGKVLPPKNDKIALIDADTIAFTACLNAEEELEVLAESFYTPEEWLELQENYDPITDAYYESDPEMRIARADEKIQKILEQTGCQEMELHFTGGRDNFRYQMHAEYKANRKGMRTPTGLVDLKNVLVEKYGGIIHTKWEADDAVVYHKRENPDKYILVAMDKDVIYSVPGKHFNYYESGHYNIDMKWVTTTKETARMWPYMQCILGDTSDNIQGVKGIGPKKALKFIADDMTPEQLWEGVVKAWESKGLEEVDAMITMNLVNMHLLDKDENDEYYIKKWRPYEL